MRQDLLEVVETSQKEALLDRQTANKLSPLASIPQGVYEDYIEYRISSLYRSLEGAASFDEVLKAQGQIMELRRLKNLREEIKHGKES